MLFFLDGHGKFESIGALAVSGFLVLAGLGIGHHSVEVMMPLFSATEGILQFHLCNLDGGGVC